MVFAMCCLLMDLKKKKKKKIVLGGGGGISCSSYMYFTVCILVFVPCKFMIDFLADQFLKWRAVLKLL